MPCIAARGRGETPEPPVSSRDIIGRVNKVRKGVYCVKLPSPLYLLLPGMRARAVSPGLIPPPVQARHGSRRWDAIPSCPSISLCGGFSREPFQSLSPLPWR